MIRMLFSIGFMMALSCNLMAQPQVEYTTIKLTLYPSAMPKPLGKIKLYPTYGEMTPGQRVQGLLRSFMEQTILFKTVESEEWQEEMNRPLDQFKASKKYRSIVKNGIAYENSQGMLAYLDRSARYSSIEWNEYFDIRREGYGLLIPEVQKMRSLASLLKMRCRYEIADGQFDKAVVTVTSLMGIAQALERYPCLVANLVSHAIAQIALQEVELMIQQPGCPNLYWALSDLPSPIISQRLALEGESSMIEGFFKKWLTTDRPLTDREIEQFFDIIEPLFKMNGDTSLIAATASAKVQFALLVANVKRIAAARKELIDRGANPDVVKLMPDLQVAILDEFARAIIVKDEYVKMFNMPYHELSPFAKNVESEVINAKNRGDIIGPMILPALWKTRFAQLRINQQVALLRTAEAVRYYAHQNNGNLPKSLGDTGLPIPTDPVTGKAMSLTISNSTATVFGSDTFQGAYGNRKFEITIRK